VARAAPIAILLPALLVPAAGASAHGRRDGPPDVIRWPSREFATLQEALDAATGGPELVLAPGTFVVDEPLVVRGPVRVRGAGCSERLLPRPPRRGLRRRSGGVAGAAGFEPRRVPRRRFTRLVGPAPDRLVEAGRAAGLFELVGPDAGGTLRGLELTGFDAAVLVPAPERPAPGDEPPRPGQALPLTLDGICVRDAGRGVLVRRPVPLTVSGSSFEGLLGNGISFTNPMELEEVHHVHVEESVFHDTLSCLHFQDTFAVVADTLLAACGAFGGINASDTKLLVFDTAIVGSAGPGIQAVDSTGSILDGTQILNTNGYGILIDGSSFTIQDVFVHTTHPRPHDGKFGDGITAFASNAFVTRTRIRDSARAGISNFGGSISLGENRIACAGFELEGEPEDGDPFYFEDQGGNRCGCPVANGACVAVSAGLEPPEPLEGVE
jgi:hypothetical protein